MRRKYRRLRKKENVIVFPGTFEKLIENGTAYVELEKYEEAVEMFDQAILYEPDTPEFLVPYAIALYETKDFNRAKEIAAILLHSGPTDYIGAMELYLTISIQLQEYEEVEMTIDTLIGEGVIPNELLNKFSYLRDLNNRLSERYGTDEPAAVEALFTIDAFTKMDPLMQQNALISLEGTNLNAMIPLLAEIVERPDLSPLVITFALTLLQQASYTGEVMVRKFGSEVRVVPAEIMLPGQDDKTKNVLIVIEQLLLKDPSRLELAKGIIEKFVITAFPFSWENYGVEEIASAYIHYIECLFSGDQIPGNSLYELIQRIDTQSDLSMG